MTGNNERFEYTKCYVVYIDVLGFKNKIEEGKKDPEILAKLVAAMFNTASIPSGGKAATVPTPNTWYIQTRSFSDSVAVFMPTEGGSLSQMLFMIRYLHDRLIELDLCIRGAVTIGGMYWHKTWGQNIHIFPREPQTPSEFGPGFTPAYNMEPQKMSITLGPGLIAAYNLEQDCAIYPRVLVSPELFEFVKKSKFKSSPFGPNNSVVRRLKEFFRKDADGLYFLDLLHPLITRYEDERILRNADGNSFSIVYTENNHMHQQVMDRVQSLVDKYLDQQSTVPEKIKAKYGWLNSYLVQIRKKQKAAQKSAVNN